MKFVFHLRHASLRGLWFGLGRFGFHCHSTHSATELHAASNKRSLTAAFLPEEGRKTSFTGQIKQHGFGGMALHGGEARFQGGGGRIHFAATNDFAVGGFEDEVRFPQERGLALVLRRERRVGPDGGDALFRRGLGQVHLAGKDDLAIADPEVEVELAVGGFPKFEFPCHKRSLG